MGCVIEKLLKSNKAKCDEIILKIKNHCNAF